MFRPVVPILGAMTASADSDAALRAYYALGGEQDRLGSPLGSVELERTKEIIQRRIPPPPARVADIGGGPGRYAVWLAELGYEVVLRDLMALHIEQATTAARSAGLEIDAAIGDARRLDLPDASVDVVLLLGPLYHLTVRADRLRCLEEARRVLRPDGVLFVAAISRWAPRLHAEVVAQLYREWDNLRAEVPPVEESGILPPLFEGSFTGYCHRPAELRVEIETAGLDCLALVAVEGLAFALADIEDRMADPGDREVVFDAARALERVPELLGLAPHMLATARRP
jgi:SAM-dependent methyltransferase